MRTAVAGLWYVQQPEKLADEVAAISRLTHRDPRSVAGGVAIAEAARLLAINGSTIKSESFCKSIAEKCAPIDADFGTLIRDLPTTVESDDALERIAFAGQDQPEFDRPIITPYVVPTVLAAIHCILKHPDSWCNAVTEAIRLGGDVDTLGAIVGALAGIRNGLEAIPQNLVEGVQRSDYLRLLAARYYDTIVEQNQSEASHDGRR
jgi:ADP-ribosylglycohydrolase